MNNKIVLIGCGNVGSSFAYALINQKTFVKELVLIDINKEKAEGEAMDLNHSLPYLSNKIIIKAGDYKEVENAKIVCIAAGINQKPKESRLSLAMKNKKIVEDIVQNVINNHFKGIFLVATNPLDIITNIVYKISNFSYNKVIGTGTSLDTSRLRYLIGKKLNIHPKNVHAYVIGEHGDSSFVPWSKATIGLNPITNYLNEQELNQIYSEVVKSAYEIINKKGFTNFGIGVCLVKIVNAILSNENSILTISCYNPEHDLFISQPAIINEDGIKEIIELDLTENEKKLFLKSIQVLKENDPLKNK